MRALVSRGYTAGELQLLLGGEDTCAAVRWGGGERGPAQSNCGPSLTRRALAVASRAF